MAMPGLSVVHSWQHPVLPVEGSWKYHEYPDLSVAQQVKQSEDKWPIKSPNSPIEREENPTSPLCSPLVAPLFLTLPFLCALSFLSDVYVC
jgi:hypothetical protein